LWVQFPPGVPRVSTIAAGSRVKTLRYLYIDLMLLQVVVLVFVGPEQTVVIRQASSTNPYWLPSAVVSLRSKNHSGGQNSNLLPKYPE
jgi:hypothetical protein